MAETYPVTLPGPEREGLAVPVEDHVKVIPVQGGHSRRQKLHSRLTIKQALVFKFTEDEFNTWALFVQDTLGFTKSFNLITFGLDGIKEREVWLSNGRYRPIPMSNGPFVVECEINYEQGEIIDDCSTTIIDGGTAAIEHADIIDGGDAPTTHADDYDGGAA